MKAETIRVEVGQVWIDNDSRFTIERRVRVNRIEGEYAYCSVIVEGGRDANKVRILLRRFKPTSTGYRLEVTPPK